ncbi:Phosphatidylinositol4-phosphate 5-Kinase protein [Pelomyxa schiedti]|nr:Phosphatidylinositol4-phosphate 5-Kinase protein [Pelomyxa schiedti]
MSQLIGWWVPPSRVIVVCVCVGAVANAISATMDSDSSINSVSEQIASNDTLPSSCSASSSFLLTYLAQVWYRFIGSLALLSMCGSSVSILSFLLVKELRAHPSTKLVFFLVLCDLCFSSQFAASGLSTTPGQAPQSHSGCTFQGMWIQFFGMGSVSWNAVISVNLLLMMRSPFAHGEQYHKWYHLSVWSIALSTTIAILAMDQIGSTDEGVCWIKAGVFEGWFYMFTLVYLVLAAATIVVALTRISEVGAITMDARKSIIRSMLFYVSVFIVCWIVPTIHSYIYFFTGSYLPGALFLSQMGIALQGFGNSMVWMSSPTFRRHFKHFVHIIISCGKTKDKLIEEIDDYQRIDAALRREVLRVLLTGIQKSHISRSRSIGDPSLMKPQFVSNPLFRTTSTQLSTREMGAGEMYEGMFFEYSTDVFYQIRMLDRVQDQYITSLDPIVLLTQLNKNEKFSEGRSGSFFVFSPDKQFIIKTIPYAEAHLLHKILGNYFKYLQANPDSLLVRFYGLYCIHFIGHLQTYAIIMNNMFSGSYQPHERYDLKGSWIHRKVGKRHDDNPTAVLGMDGDLKRKIALPSQLATKITHQIRLDAQFLCSLGIMDYSILLGFHFTNKSDYSAFPVPKQGSIRSFKLLSNFLNTPAPEKKAEVPTQHKTTHYTPERLVEAGFEHELTRTSFWSEDRSVLYHIGVIDILQKYDHNKKLERFWKVYCTRQNKDGISVVPPEPYCLRFISNWENNVLSPSPSSPSHHTHPTSQMSINTDPTTTSATPTIKTATTTTTTTTTSNVRTPLLGAHSTFTEHNT